MIGRRVGSAPASFGSHSKPRQRFGMGVLSGFIVSDNLTRRFVSVLHHHQAVAGASSRQEGRDLKSAAKDNSQRCQRSFCASRGDTSIPLHSCCRLGAARAITSRDTSNVHTLSVCMYCNFHVGRQRWQTQSWRRTESSTAGLTREPDTQHTHKHTLQEVVNNESLVAAHSNSSSPIQPFLRHYRYQILIVSGESGTNMFAQYCITTNKRYLEHSRLAVTL